MTPEELPRCASAAPAPLSIPTKQTTSVHADPARQEERPVKKRVVLALVYFRFSGFVQHVLVGEKVKTEAFVTNVYDFLQDTDMFDHILSCTCRDILYKEDNGRVNTVIVQFDLVDDCLKKFKDLPWSSCRPFGSKGFFFDSAIRENVLAEESLGGIWVTVPKDSPQESSSTSSSTDELNPDRSASRGSGKADSATANKPA